MSQLETSETFISTVAKQRIARILRKRILDGELRTGQSLPSERELSRQLSVGRTVVRQALAMLGDEGLVSNSGARLRTVAYNTPNEQSAWMSRSIALLMPSFDDGGKLAQQARWMRFITMGLIEHLRNRNIHVITLGSQATDLEEARRLTASRPKGLLVLESNDPEFDTVAWATTFDEAGIPVVCYGGDPKFERFDRVISDHEQGSYLLTKAMIARGARRVLQFWPRPWDRYWFEARRRGYEAAMIEHGLEPLPTYQFPQTSPPSLTADAFDYDVKVVAGFLLHARRAQSPDALMLSTDRDVPYVTAALRLDGSADDKDMLIAGYDNYFHQCEELDFEPQPPVFTVDKCNVSVGSEMVELLLDRVEGRLPPERQARSIAQRVVVPGQARES